MSAAMMVLQASQIAAVSRPEPRIALDEITCPNGHRFVEQEASRATRCGACYQGIELGQPVLGCHACDYDACISCCTTPTHPMIFEAEL